MTLHNTHALSVTSGKILT